MRNISEIQAGRLKLVKSNVQPPERLKSEGFRRKTKKLSPIEENYNRKAAEFRKGIGVFEERAEDLQYSLEGWQASEFVARSINGCMSDQVTNIFRMASAAEIMDFQNKGGADKRGRKVTDKDSLTLLYALSVVSKIQHYGGENGMVLEELVDDAISMLEPSVTKHPDLSRLLRRSKKILSNQRLAKTIEEAQRLDSDTIDLITRIAPLYLHGLAWEVPRTFETLDPFRLSVSQEIASAIVSVYLIQHGKKLSELDEHLSQLTNAGFRNMLKALVGEMVENNDENLAELYKRAKPPLKIK